MLFSVEMRPRFISLPLMNCRSTPIILREIKPGLMRYSMVFLEIRCGLQAPVKPPAAVERG